MELLNETPAVAEWTVGFQKDGREFACVVAKMTFALPPDHEKAWLATEQLPITQADEFTGEPGLSAVLLESDFAHEKPNCDVMLNGSAYAPRGVPCETVYVGLHVGPIHKRFAVRGDSVWEKGTMGFSPSPPTPFAQKTISYEIAYGGTSRSQSEPEAIKTYLENPVGRGFYPLDTEVSLAGRPLANTHEVGKPADSVKGRFRPMSLGAVGRNFKERAVYAGTYDESWQNKHAPFLPKDFDSKHFQAAPRDQQMPYPDGPLEITLENLTPDGIRRFWVPFRRIPLLVFEHNRDPQQHNFELDTILIEPDFNRLSLVHRSTIPLRKSVFDLSRIVIGQNAKQYRRGIRQQKKYYKNLDEVVKNHRRPGGR